MIKLFFLTIIFSGFSTSFAQVRTELEKKYNNESIYRYGGSFMKGTDRLNFADLEQEFYFSPIGEDSYFMAKKYRTTSTVLRYLSLASSLVTVSLITRNRNVNTLYAGLGAQIVFSLAGGYYTNLSTQQMDKALWQRNKDLLFPPGK